MPNVRSCRRGVFPQTRMRPSCNTFHIACAKHMWQWRLPRFRHQGQAKEVALDFILMHGLAASSTGNCKQHKSPTAVNVVTSTCAARYHGRLCDVLIRRSLSYSEGRMAGLSRGMLSAWPAATKVARIPDVQTAVGIRR